MPTSVTSTYFEPPVKTIKAKCKTLRQDYHDLKTGKPLPLDFASSQEEEFEVINIISPAVAEEEEEVKLDAGPRCDSIVRLEAVAERAGRDDAMAIMGLMALEMNKLNAAGYIWDAELRTVGVKKEGAIGQRFGLSMLSTFADSGSKLYFLLRRALNLPCGEVFDPYRELYYCHHTQIFLKKWKTELEESKSPDEQKKKLIETTLAEISEHIKKVKVYCEQGMQEIALRRFSARQIKENFTRIPEEYLRLKEEKNEEPAREQELALLRIINKKLIFDEQHYGQATNMVRLATVVHLMDMIEQGKIPGVGIGSKLYIALGRAINLKSTWELTVLDKYTLDSTMHQFLPKIDPSKDEPCSWLTDPIPNGRKFLSDSTKHLLKSMNQGYADLENNKIYRVAHGAQLLVDAGMFLAVHSLIGMVTGGIISYNPVSSGVSSYVGSYFFGSYGYAGKFLAERLVVMGETAAATSLVVYGAKYVTDPVTRLPGQATYLTVSLPFIVGEWVAECFKSPPQVPFCQSKQYINMWINRPDTTEEQRKTLKSIDIYDAPLAEVEAPVLRRSASASNLKLG